MLEVKALQAGYGNSNVLHGLSLSVPKGSFCTLIGANGAGKSTTMKAIAGLVRPVQGSIEFEGKPIGHLPAAQIVTRGIALVPEGRRVFGPMSVRENLQMGAYIRDDKAEILQDIDKVFTIFPRLKERRDQLAGTMSGGEQQMLAMGRALMSRPKVLLLDEPSMGLAPIMVDKIFEVVRDVSAQGVTVLLVEQNTVLALEVANRAYVIENGHIVLDGPARDLASHPRVREAYLGA